MSIRMFTEKYVFSQLLSHLPQQALQRIVKRHHTSSQPRQFSYQDQLLCMMFAQLSYRDSLRDTVTCLSAHPNKLYHLGIRGGVARSTLADANETRPWIIWHDFAHQLIRTARQLYLNDTAVAGIDHTIYALDTTTIDLCLSVFPWAKFRAHKGAVKLHTLLDLRGNIPSFIDITDGKTHEVNVLDKLPIEAGSFYVMDRRFTDFARLYALHQAQAFFLIRAKSNLQQRRVYSKTVDKTTGLRCDQTIALKTPAAKKAYPQRLRRVKFYDAQTNKTLVFLTNNHTLPALTIAELYRSRWQVELFFKWIKQHLRIKSFFGTSENAVKTQIWIAISTYVLVAIVKKRLQLDASLYTILQILSVSLFDKTNIIQLLTNIDRSDADESNRNQLNLFE